MAFNTEGLLASIGRGLKLGAGVMNPQIYEEQGRERLLAEQQAQARKDQMFKLVFAGVQNGSIPQEQGKDILLKLRPELAGQLPDGAIGPTQDVLDAQQERAANAEWKTRHNINPYLGDDIAKLEYERANPKPSPPTEIERLHLAEDRARAAGNMPLAEEIAKVIQLKTTRPPQRDRYGVLQNDQGYPIGQYSAGPGGTRIDMFDGQPSRTSELPDVPTRNVGELALGTGPSAAVGRGFSKTVGALFGLGSNATRDQRQARYSTIREQIYGATRVPGARSNMNLMLALEKLPNTGVFENPARAETMLNEVFSSLAKAHEEAVKVANNPRVPKQISVAAAEQAEAIKGVFDTLSLPFDNGKVSKPKTEAEFDALPSGATYIDPDDGKKYRKP